MLCKIVRFIKSPESSAAALSNQGEKSFIFTCVQTVIKFCRRTTERRFDQALIQRDPQKIRASRAAPRGQNLSRGGRDHHFLAPGSCATQKQGGITRTCTCTAVLVHVHVQLFTRYLPLLWLILEPRERKSETTS